MFTIGIRYLNGWAMAAVDGAKKERAEWPPHPDRVFMALAAAFFETEGGDAERKTLEWLEQQEPPALAGSTESRQRSLVTHFVPVNDTGISSTKTVAKAVAGVSVLAMLKDFGLSQLPEFRSRQGRNFPVALPYPLPADADPTLFLVWEADLPDAHRAPLASLCRKATHVGHPASLVQMWLADKVPKPGQPMLVPRSGITRHRLRITGPGRLRALEARYNRAAVIEYADWATRLEAAKKPKERAVLKAEIDRRFPEGKPVSRRPETALAVGYDRPSELSGEERAHLGAFDSNLVVLALAGHRLTLHSTLKLTEGLRSAVMKACPEQPPPEWISGHGSDRSATTRPHLAFVPLPFVEHEHADGRVLGLALALPHGLDPDEAVRCLGPFLWDTDTGEPREIHLFDGQWFECRASLELRENPPYNLRAEAWIHASTRWATVTPIALDRHFDGKDKWEKAAENIKDGCERMGLPRPVDVLLHPVSRIEGAPRSSEFPYLTRKSDGSRIHHCHADLVFPEAIRGPLLLGAGRFRGYGLCRPLRQGGGAP